MASKRLWQGIPAIALVFAIAVSGCASSNPYQGMSPETRYLAAARHGELDTVIEMLEEGVDINTLSLPTYSTHALTYASYMGHMDVVQYLVEHGADIDMTSGNGMETALIMAVKLGEPAIARYLIDSGANVNITDASGNTAAFYAEQNEDHDLCQYLYDHGAIEQ